MKANNWRCANCLLWQKLDPEYQPAKVEGKEQVLYGDCVAVPPTPLLIGMRIQPIPGSGIMQPGKAPQGQQIPVVDSYYPRTSEHHKCGVFRDKSAASKSEFTT